MDKQKGNILTILVVIILLGALVAGVYLVQTKQLLKSRASNDPITPVGSNVSLDNGVWKTSSPTVEFELRSPLAPAVSP